MGCSLSNFLHFYITHLTGSTIPGPSVMGNCASLLEDRPPHYRGLSRSSFHSKRTTNSSSYHRSTSLGCSEDITLSWEHKQPARVHFSAAATPPSSPMIELPQRTQLSLIDESPTSPQLDDGTGEPSVTTRSTWPDISTADRSFREKEGLLPLGIIPTLEFLGCKATIITDDPLLRFYSDAELLTFYEISRQGKQKARLGVYTNPGQSRLQSTRLYIYDIWTDPPAYLYNDEEDVFAPNTGGDADRVKGHQILLAFWTYTLRRDPGMLRRLYFESVLEEKTTQVLQQQICPRLGTQWCANSEEEGLHAAPWETVNVYRPYNSDMSWKSFPYDDDIEGPYMATENELITWGLLVGEIGSGSRLVKMALHMCAAYPRTDEYTGMVQVERVVFRPKMGGGSGGVWRPLGYDLEIRMGLEDSLAHRFVGLQSYNCFGIDEKHTSMLAF